MRRIFLIVLVCLVLSGCSVGNDTLEGSYNLVLSAQDKAELLVAGISATNAKSSISFDSKNGTFHLNAFGYIDVNGTFELSEDTLTLSYVLFLEDIVEVYQFKKEGKSIWLNDEEYVKGD